MKEPGNLKEKKIRELFFRIKLLQNLLFLRLYTISKLWGKYEYTFEIISSINIALYSFFSCGDSIM